jgi:hypothetical protein
LLDIDSAREGDVLASVSFGLSSESVIANIQRLFKHTRTPCSSFQR